ncbi:hypothetical protein MFLO_16214, partial [Listeria floridensis FSL S10-1187]
NAQWKADTIMVDPLPEPTPDPDPQPQPIDPMDPVDPEPPVQPEQPTPERGDITQESVESHDPILSSQESSASGRTPAKLPHTGDQPFPTGLAVGLGSVFLYLGIRRLLK